MQLAVSVPPLALQHGRQRGFTLIELLIAMGIFALISALAYGGLRSVLDQQQALGQRQQRLAGLQMAWQWLGRDLVQAVPRPVRTGAQQRQAAVYYNDLDGLSLSHAGWVNPLGRPRSNVQRVHYFVQDEQLMRASWPALDRSASSEAQQVMLLSGIKDWHWRFLDASDQWQTQWPPLSTGTTSGGAATPNPLLPRAVEVRLELAGWGEINRFFTLPGQ